MPRRPLRDPSRCWPNVACVSPCWREMVFSRRELLPSFGPTPLLRSQPSTLTEGFSFFDVPSTSGSLGAAVGRVPTLIRLSARVSELCAL